MNKKAGVLIIVLIVIVLVLGGLWISSSKRPVKHFSITPQNNSSPKKPSFLHVITAETAIQQFPEGLPVGAPKQALISYQDAQNGVYEFIYQYTSAAALTNIAASYKQYFTANKWSVVAPVSNATTQVVVGQKGSETILVTANQSGSSARVSVKLQEPLLTGFPGDFPTEKGATIISSGPAASSTPATTSNFLRYYTSNLTLAQNYQIFSSYLNSGGWHVGPGNFNNAQSKSIIATKLNASLQVIMIEKSPTDPTVVVQAQLTIFP